MISVDQHRWQEAQRSEAQYWMNVDIDELLSMPSEKMTFLRRLGTEQQQRLFDHKAVLEIGVGPLGISLASFYRNKATIQRLVKLEPLPQTPLDNFSVMQETWALPFVEWMDSLAHEGLYHQIAGEQMPYDREFDTVVIYNVLDHVQDPQKILQNAYQALRSKGRILIGVDCRSVLGRLKFEQILRRTAKGTIMVDAHPYTFLPQHVVKLLIDAGFLQVQTLGLPSRWQLFAGSVFRPAFIALKP